MEQKHPTLVLIHAFPLHSAMWEPQRNALSHHAEIFTPDLPGFGKEPGLDGEGFSMNLAALFIQRELEANKIERCILGGLSMGGYIAFECWRLFPERIAGLILADTKASPDSEEARRGRFDGAEQIGRGDFEVFAENLMKKLLSEKTRNEHPEVVETVRGIMMSSPPEAAVVALLGMAARIDSTPTLSTISVPTALVFGEHDAITTVEEGKKMSEAIPDATLTIVRNAGHLSNIENPSEFNAAVIELLERVAEPAH